MTETMHSVTIAGRKIGPDHPPFVVAELSSNHNGKIDRAFRLMEAAKESGASALKIQTYTADTITLDDDGPDFVIHGGLWSGRRLHDLYREAATPWEWHKALFTKAAELGLPVFSSPFDFTAVDFLEELDCPAYKIASFELVDLPLIERCARTGKPLIMSTGLANAKEVGEAVSVARNFGCKDLVLLHCVSGYPAPPEDFNLRTLVDLKQRFGVQTGLSDHSLGASVAVAAVALGATVVEKHMTLRRADGGPDSGFSMEPEEFSQLVEDCRIAWAALGRVSYSRKNSEAASAPFRRSLYVVADVGEGERLTHDNVRSIRPGYGLAPKHLDVVLGRNAARDLRRGERLCWDMLK